MSTFCGNIRCHQMLVVLWIQDGNWNKMMTSSIYDDVNQCCWVRPLPFFGKSRLSQTGSKSSPLSRFNLGVSFLICIASRKLWCHHLVPDTILDSEHYQHLMTADVFRRKYSWWVTNFSSVEVNFALSFNIVLQIQWTIWPYYFFLHNF